MPSEIDSPALPPTEISAAVSSPPIALPPAGQDGRDAQRAVAGPVHADTTAGAASIPIASTEQSLAKQPMSQRHPSNTFYRSCEISFMEPVGSMSISPANRDVVLAARKGLFIIDLEDPFAPPRFLAHMTTWEAVDIQWSPHPARSNWVASTSNQKLLIWNLDRPGDPRAAPPLTRMLHRGSIHSTSSPAMPTNSHFATQRSSAYQSIYNSHSLLSGVTGGTRSGAGAVSAGSPYAETPLSATSPMQLAVPRSSAIEHVLHAHTRAITDINWSPFHPEIVASSSIDTWTWVWDLRMSGTGNGGARRKPAQGYSAWNAAVTQVKFNRASEHRLASTCDNKVLIWDDRKGSLPLATIEAHESKIYGIDWSRDTSLGLDRLVTCSLDRTVKFWNLASDTSQAAIGARELVTEAESIIETRTPMWRARYLPFGNGVMTLPQRGDTTLSMWSKDQPEEPQATFAGHTDIVKEYLFRTKGGQDKESDDRQFQLITWSKDQTLRLWPVSDEQARKVGHKPGGPIRMLLTRANAPNISYRDPPLSLPPGGEGAAMMASQASASNISTSSILPPEHATRSLLSGKGSGSKIQATSPYSSSMSGFQNVIRDGRTSPLVPFATSAGKRSLHHSSSHGDLGSELHPLSHSPRDTFPRSWGRVEGQQFSGSAFGRTYASQLARSLPKQAGEDHANRFGTSHRSSKYGGGSVSQHSGGHSAFKVPANRRGKTVSGSAAGGKQKSANPHQSSGRPLPIQEERNGVEKHSGKLGDRKEKDRAAKKEERRKLAKATDPRTTKGAVGAAMRLDRGRAAAPTVDPIEWIANVRLEKETADHEEQTGGETSNARDLDGMDPSRLTISKVAGAGVAFGQGLTTEDDTDAEAGFTAQGLGDEIIGINRKLPRVVFEKVELTGRMCVLTMYGPWADHEPAFLRIKIKFPASYPKRPPHFDLEKNANISLKTRAYLLRGLCRLSTKAAKMGRPCLEICSRFLIGEPIKSLDGDDHDRGKDDEGDVDLSSNRVGGSIASDTDPDSDSDHGMLAFRPARTTISPGEAQMKLKMSARRMGASFGPNHQLVVFGGSLNHYPQSSRNSSRHHSRQASRSASQAPPTADARSKSVSALARGKSGSRPVTSGTQDADSEGAGGLDRNPGWRNGKEREADERGEESRFLRSYTALSNAMSSLAHYSRTASQGVSTGYSVRDSDVVQLMSTDFFARRLLRKKDFFDIFGSTADCDAGEAKGNGGTQTPNGKYSFAARQKARQRSRFYSGSGASTPGATRNGGGNGGGGRGIEEDEGGSADEARGGGANLAHHADLLGSLPAPAALLAIGKLKETQRRRQIGLVTIYQFVETVDGEGTW
ncbi:related to MTC5 - subunit of the SEA complex [Melanopsichium pennsylvanicum]|uniref:Related to MTC5 - subunit of the SEA complex n=2 Tax=Melanopsichium pennsylvanicum TaxID=63383 RepID=A0AAJ4XGR7_9BASI|nr:vacuolar membrane protein [Melanopsichium pennsylvanicum 4]SNX82027.1 related to MTC5 - subunit of the SEA complex [Melanopsichium pennsylvanicum]